MTVRGLSASLSTLCAITFAALPSLPAQVHSHDGDRPRRTAPWDPEVVAAMAALPVQQEGRVQPFAALAASTLHSVHGRRDMKLEPPGAEKVTLSPTEWLLDVWIYPDQAADYPLFRIENSELLDAIGIAREAGQKLRLDFVTYRQMLTGEPPPGQRLFDLSHQIARKDQKARTAVDNMVADLARKLGLYHELHQQLGVLHSDFALEGEALRAVFDGESRALFGDLVGRAVPLAGLLRQMQDNQSDPKFGNAMQIARLLSDLTQHPAGPALFPPPPSHRSGDQKAAETWLNLGDAIDYAMAGGLPQEQLGAVQALQQAIVASDPGLQKQALLAFQQGIVGLAKARGEYDKVELEVSYLTEAWHYKSLHWFLFAFLVCGAAVLLPSSRLLWFAGLALTVLPLGFLTWDIVLRCLIRSRPPITNLYDTFLFIAATGVLVALVTEVITRRRIMLFLGPAYGALIVMLARLYEVEDGQDTLKPLQAVLDTNYYLATHVTSINLGYAAGVLASALATVWLLLQAIVPNRIGADVSKAIVRMVYAVTCFGLIFAVFGTIYGGVWANDSWGRFWGWDPKENGALLICLSQIALLHARMSGLVRDFGFCVWAAFTGIVVAFSWFHVNLLGVGLHAYGFSAAVRSGLFTYYTVESVLIAIGVGGVLLRRWVAAAAARAAAGVDESGAAEGA
jgi:ABC-type transport system involved in cytochrome c biogenesis permease subunit